MTDPYAQLAAHVISVKALHCADGCGLVETSGYGEDEMAAEELVKRGWVVREHSMGGLTAVCRDCAARSDQESAAQPQPLVKGGAPR